MSNLPHYKIWERHHGMKVPTDKEIHHIDGNHYNNDPSNLMAVTIEEHLEIHRNQKDWGAVQAILMRMELTDEVREEIKNSASKHQIELLEKGLHNWQKEESKKKRIDAIELEHERRRNLGLGAFLGISDTVENSRRGGRKAAELCAGFLDTDSDHHGSKAVRGTVWWTNIITGKRKRSHESPGGDWKSGMGSVEVKNVSAISGATKNTYWWVNTITGKRVRTVDCPGAEWKRGIK